MCAASLSLKAPSFLLVALRAVTPPAQFAAAVVFPLPNEKQLGNRSPYCPFRDTRCLTFCLLRNMCVIVGRGIDVRMLNSYLDRSQKEVLICRRCYCEEITERAGSSSVSKRHRALFCWRHWRRALRRRA